MKIQFENNLEYQDRAISSIVDIFADANVKTAILKQYDIDDVVSI